MRSLVFIIVLINLKIKISLLENPSPNYENLVQDLEKRLSVQKALNARLRSRLTKTGEDDRIRRGLYFFRFYTLYTSLLISQH